jgi:hypothetical protein
MQVHAQSTDRWSDLQLDLVRGALPTEIELLGSQAVDNPYACLLHARAYSAELIPRLHHLVVRADERLLGILSFHQHGTRLVVVNGCIALPADVLDRCVLRLYAEYPSATRVEFRKLRDADAPSGSGHRVLSRRVATGMHNYVLRLPATTDEYQRIFVKKTRQKLRSYERRLSNECENLEFAILEATEIDSSVVEAIVQLNHKRMAAKGTHSLIDDAYTRKLLALCQTCGVVCVYRTGARILAGTIGTRVGHGWSLEVTAHDCDFDHLSLGFLCLFRTVETAIRSRATTVNFLWGDNPYKLRFGAQPIPLCDRHFYRNRIAWLSAFDVIVPALRESARRRVRAVKRWLLDGRFGPVARFVFRRPRRSAVATRH